MTKFHTLKIIRHIVNTALLVTSGHADANNVSILRELLAVLVKHDISPDISPL